MHDSTIGPIRAAWILASALVLLASGGARADHLRLDDGSRLVGTLIRLADGQVQWQTDYAGALTVPVDRVSAIGTDGTVTVTLRSGNRLIGRLRESDDGTQQVVGTAFGDLAIELNDVARAEPVADEGPGPPEDTATAVDEAVAQALSLDSLWSGRIEIGLDGRTGTSERFGFRGMADARRETPTERLRLFIAGEFAQTDGTQSSNEVRGGGSLEVDITRRWFAGGRFQLKFDELEELDLRATVSAGVGYYAIRQEGHELKARAALGYEHESFMDGTIENQAILELGYEYSVDLTEALTFANALTYYPTLEDPLGDYRLEVETSLELALNEQRTLSLRGGMRNEYNAMPRPGIERLQTSYFLNIGYDW